MAIYAITWQLNSLQPHPEEQEKRIIEKIKTLPHYNDSDLKHVWFVSTPWRADRLHRYLYKCFEAPDGYLITEISNKSGHGAWGGKVGDGFSEFLEKSGFTIIPPRIDWEPPRKV